MEYEAMVQSVLDEIDRRITENIRADELARAQNYSTYHFCRVFMALTGTPVMVYVTRRKLAYALYDLSRGGKVIDAAMDYGFETHAGFTKAFKKCYGCPPSFYRLHVMAGPPERATIESVKQFRHGGIKMQVQIREIAPFIIIGYASRHRMPGVGRNPHVPAFWTESDLDYEAALSTLHNSYVKSHHCEISLCLDIDEEHERFTYMLGVGVDEADHAVPQRPGTYLHNMQGGLYAIFTTPLVQEHYAQSIKDTWKEILEHWLPESKYEYDNTRVEYEYYDERDHGRPMQMDIYVPVK